MGGHARDHGRLLRDPGDRSARAQYRLFCRLENGTPEELAARGFQERQIAVITGMCKPFRTVFSDREYKTNVRALGDDYLATLPRRVAT